MDDAANTDTDGIAITVPGGTMPEVITVNGVRYLRQADGLDELVNRINGYRIVAARTRVPLREVVWLARGETWP